MRHNFMPLLVFVVFLSGCASITAGTTQSVAVDTNPQRPAECRLSNEKGTWFVRTPGTTTVTKANGPLSASCSTTDGWGGSAAVQSTTAGAAFGNILAGGIIGAAVDMSSGAAYVYPAQIIVPLGQNTAYSPPPIQPVGQNTAYSPPPIQPVGQNTAYSPPPIQQQNTQVQSESRINRNYNRPRSHTQAKPD